MFLSIAAEMTRKVEKGTEKRKTGTNGGANATAGGGDIRIRAK